MQVQSFNPVDIKINPALRARRGEPDKNKVMRLAENFLARREAGLAHQLQPGIVRLDEDGSVTLIAGEHRKEGCAYLNTMIPEGGEPYLFWAVAVAANDEQALIDAITENEYRNATNLLDRAEAMQKLADLGKTQTEIAKVFGVSDSEVSQTLPCAKAAKKYQKMYLDGTIKDKGLQDICTVGKKNPKLVEAMIALALQYDKAEDELNEKIEAIRGIQAGDAINEPEPPEEDDSANDVLNDEDQPEPAKPAKKKGNTSPKPRSRKAGTISDRALSRAKAEVTTGKSKKSIRDLCTLLEASFGSDEMVNGKPVPEPVKKLYRRICQWASGDVKKDQTLIDTFFECCKGKF